MVERGLFALAAVVGIERFSGALFTYWLLCIGALQNVVKTDACRMFACRSALSLYSFSHGQIWGSREEHTLHIDGSDLFASDARTYDNMLQLASPHSRSK